MKIFIDIGHPAHVHYFKNLISRLSQKGHQFIITARDKDIAHFLLNKYNIGYYPRGRGADSFLGKILYLIRADINLLKIAIKEKPDLFLSFGSPYCAQVSSVMGKPHIAIDDTENAHLGQFLYRPFTDCILTPDCFNNDFGDKHLRFPSYMELAYLHPNLFQPDDSVLKKLGVNKNEMFTIIRFVGWGAVHDAGHHGISLENKIKVANTLSKYSKVFISSEMALPDELKEFSIDIPVEKMHDALAFASLFYGESATMASEAAVLGTPAIYLDNDGRGYTDEQERKYGLVYNYSESEEDQIASIKKAEELFKNWDEKHWNAKREKLLKDKIDLSTFLVWFIENYPESRADLSETPSIFERFT